VLNGPYTNHYHVLNLFAYCYITGHTHSIIVPAYMQEVALNVSRSYIAHITVCIPIRLISKLTSYHYLIEVRHVWPGWSWLFC